MEKSKKTTNTPDASAIVNVKGQNAIKPKEQKPEQAREADANAQKIAKKRVEYDKN